MIAVKDIVIYIVWQCHDCPRIQVVVIKFEMTLLWDTGHSHGLRLMISLSTSKSKTLYEEHPDNGFPSDARVDVAFSGNGFAVVMKRKARLTK